VESDPLHRPEIEKRVALEESRIREEYARRRREVDAELYAPWDRAQAFLVEGRRVAAAALLHERGVFPQSGSACLEVGCGSIGWLAELISWGVSETDLKGVDLLPDRVARAKGVLPAADLRCGSATQLPWGDRSFGLVILSTVMSSVLDRAVRRLIAEEVTRVLRPGGALLWYDFAVNNPRNPNVQGVSKNEVVSLFPALQGRFRAVNLAPPIARRVVRWSRPLAALLEAIPLLRTHLVGVLVKPT
jgi:ubiquinone/menaquinone biosynthesis C-methylase UbiE